MTVRIEVRYRSGRGTVLQAGSRVRTRTEGGLSVKRIDPAAIQEEIKRQREAIRAKVLPQVEAEWEEMLARHAQDTAEMNAIAEVNRERRSRAQASTEARPVTSQENSEMAIDTTTETTAQPGRKKKSARQRIQNEMAAAGARSKRNRKAGGLTLSPSAKTVGGKKLPAGHPVVKAIKAAVVKDSTKKNGQHGVVEERKAEAKKLGVRIKLWKKGSQSGKFTEVFQVYVNGTRHFAISGNIDSLAAAKAAAKAAGFEVKSLPEAAKKK